MGKIINKIMDKKGFNIIEVVVISVISFIVLFAIYKVLNNYYKNYNIHQQIFSMQEDATYAMDTIINGFFTDKYVPPRLIKGIVGAEMISIPPPNNRKLVILDGGGLKVSEYHSKPSGDGYYQLVCTDDKSNKYYILPRIKGSGSNTEKYSKIGLTFFREDASGGRKKVKVKLLLSKKIGDKQYTRELEETAITMPK